MSRRVPRLCRRDVPRLMRATGHSFFTRLNRGDLLLLYVDGRVSPRSGPAQLQMDLLHALGYRPWGVSPAPLLALVPAVAAPAPPPAQAPPRRSTVWSRRLHAYHADLSSLESTQRQAARARLRPGLPSEPHCAASSMAWRCSRTARSSNWHPFAWPTRNSASRAPTTLRSRRSRSNTLTC